MIPAQLHAVRSLKVDYVGAIFYEKSPRYAADIPGFSAAFSQVAQEKNTLGVFVNASSDKIYAMSERFPFSTVQLHGTETPEQCRSLRRSFTVVKAFGVDAFFSFSEVAAYEDVVDFFVFDTKCSGHGGSGRSFDWDILHAYGGDTPFLLSGGIGPHTLSAIRDFSHPALMGVDINSRFERAPGDKNMEQVEFFCKEYKGYD